MTHTRTREVEDTLTGTPGGIAKEVDRRHQAGELVWVAPAKQLPSGLWQSRLKVRVPVQASRDVQVRPARLPVRVQAVPVVAVRPWWRRRWPYVTAGVSTTLAGLWWAVVTIFGFLAEFGTTILGFLACLTGLYALAVAKTGCPGLHCFGCSCSR
jgi:hypothetical protein